MPDPKNTLGEALTIPKLRLDQAIHNSEAKAEKHSFGRDSKQYYLYFEPSGAIKQRVIVYIHGGGWMTGTPNRYKYIGKKFSDMGYHTLSLGYRHTPLYKYPAQARDVFTALVKGLALLEKKGVNTDNIVIVGSSAGGHLGGILTYDKTLQREFGIDNQKIRGFVSLGGVLSFNVEYLATTQLLIEALFEKNFDRKTAEPISLVNGSEQTRVLCIHAKNDPISEVENEKLFVDHVNHLKPGTASSLIIRDEDMFHSNLVMGVFFEDPEESDPLKVLFRWIECLPLRKAGG
ncbi:MAG: alpha/beta hydrolase, partial [Clostridiales bacterium]|nr:alpha/beta hydrolase [Clostridiales bacterium]